MLRILRTPRAAILAVFAAFGVMVGSFAGSVPQMMAATGLDNAGYGLAVTLHTVAAVAGMASAGALARRFSHRALLLALLPIMLALFAATLLAGAAASFIVAVTAFGLAMGATDVIMNAEGGAIEVDVGHPIYTGFHASVSLSVAVFAIVSSLLSTIVGPGATVAAAAIAVVAAIVCVAAAVPPRSLPPARPRPPLAAFFTLPLVLMGAAAGLVISAEVSALFWSSKLLAETAPELAAIAGLGAAFFGLTNAVVRLPGDRLRSRFGEIRLMTGSLMVAIVGFAGLALTTSFAANVGFFALTGMGLAVLCPCLFAMAAGETPENRAAGLSAALLIAGAPRIVAPTAFGAIAEAASTRTAFLLSAVILVGALIAIRALAARTRPARARQPAVS